MRVLLTGATGFVGRALGRRLIEAGNRLVVLSRSPERAREHLGFDCELHPWDPLSEPAPEAAFEGGVDAVVHLAGEPLGAHRWSPRIKARIAESRVVGTRNLVATLNRVSAANEGRPGVLVAASGIGIYGDRGDEVLTDDSLPGTGFLAEVCEGWEREAHRAFGLRVAILRLGMVLGQEGGALQKILPVFRRGLGGKLGSGEQWLSWVHLDDVCGLFQHVLKSSTLEGVLNGVSPIPATNASFTLALSRALRKPARLRVPAVALRLGYGEMAEMLLASQRVLPVKARASGYHFKYEKLDDALAASV